MNSSRKTGFRFTALLLATSGIVAPQAFAQSGAAAVPEDNSGITDIVVTARRTSESMQSTPVAITAFGADELKARAIEGLSDLQRATPSFQTNTNVSNSAGLQIGMRGQVMTNTSANTPASVGIYLDDVYLGGASLAGSLVNVEDLERVEVLKGAQGTLYGRNVTGGLVKFVTRKPESEFDASITGGLGNYERRYVSGMINVPFVEDRVALRVNGLFDEHSGYSHDIKNDRELEDLHRWGLRGALKIDPTEKLSVLLQGWVGKGHDGGTDVRTNYMQPGLTTFALNVIAAQRINGLTPQALSPIIFFGSAVRNGTATPAQAAAFNNALGAALAALPAAQKFVSDLANAPRDQAQEATLYPQFSRARSRGGAGTISYDLGQATLRSITAYDFSRAVRGFNVGGGPYVPVFTNSIGQIGQFTQEFQATGKALDSRLTYAVGLYYLNMKLVDERNSIGNPGGAFPLFLGQNGLGVLNSTVSLNNLRTISKAAYGQATYALTDTLNFTGGLRYTREKVRGRALQYVLGTLTCAGPAPATSATPLAQCEQRQSVRSSNLSYTAGFDYTVAPGVMVYAKTSRGFKAGGVDTFPPTGGPYSTYKPEISTDYEIGFKSDFFDRKVRLNATYFHTDYEDIQRTITVVVNPATNTLGTVTRNAASAKIDGVEFELQASPVKDLVLSLSGAYTDARFSRYDLVRPGVGFPNDLQDISSQPFQTVAKFTYNLGANYSFDIGENKVTAGAYWSHRSSANLYPLDQFPSTAGGTDITPAEFTTQKAYGVLNGSLSIEVPSVHATVAVWGKNILNKRYAQTISGLVNNGLGLAFANYGPPATFGVDLTFRYR